MDDADRLRANIEDVLRESTRDYRIDGQPIAMVDEALAPWALAALFGPVMTELRRMEWSGTDETQDDGWCPSCGGFRPDHTRARTLAAALAPFSAAPTPEE